MGNKTPRNNEPKKSLVVEVEPAKKDLMIVQLLFTVAQEKDFRIVEERLMKKFRTRSTTETVLRAIKTIK